MDDKPVVGKFATPPPYAQPRLRSADGLSQGPTSGKFWGGMAKGLYDNVVAPIAQDFDQGHKAVKENYPLAYQVAQLHPAVGIPTSIKDYADADNVPDKISAALSSIPVMETSYKVATTLPKTLRGAYQSAMAHSAGIAGPASLPTRLGAHTAAAANTVQMGTGANAQFTPRERR